MKSFRLLISCEHASNKIPAVWARKLKIPKKVLSSHCGYDIGVQSIARGISKHFKTSYVEGKYSRLLVDLNRTSKSRSLFSKWALKNLSSEERSEILQKFYLPHVEMLNNKMPKQTKACYLHLGIHSFTPVLHGAVRNNDFGVLYDPKRSLEKKISKKLVESLRQIRSDFHTRYNYPYRGDHGGIVEIFRSLHSPSNYLGLEIEVNQKWLQSKKAQKEIQEILIQAISSII